MKKITIKSFGGDDRTQDENLNTIVELVKNLIEEEHLIAKVMNSEETEKRTTAYAGLDCVDYNGERFSIIIDRGGARAEK